MNPLISIITPTRNAGKVLEKSILSVINQDFENFEYIIIDGASNDNTVEIINKYKNYIDFFISEQDRGIYDAMNKGITLSRGEWIYFLGSDDILCNNILIKVAKILKNKNTIYYGNVYWGNLNQIYDGPFNQYKIAKQNMCHQSIFYPRTVFTKYSYNLKFPIYADYHLNIQLFFDPDFVLEYFPNTVAKFSFGGTSSVILDNQFDMHKKELINRLFPKNVIIYLYMYDFYNKIKWKLSELKRKFNHISRFF